MAEQQTRGDLKIAGAGSGSGGLYDTVNIAGAGKITGDVEARSVHIAGAGEIEGGVKADDVKLAGAAKIRGGVDAAEVHASGASRFDGAVKAGTLRLSGSAKVAGAVHAREVEAAGGCTFGADVEAANFRATGSLSVEGLLSADHVEVSLMGKSKVREIGGETVTVVGNAGRGAPGRRKWWTVLAEAVDAVGGTGTLEAQSIEGDEVYLESTRAAVVRGRRVTIGPGCTVALVEFGESLHIDPGANIAAHTYTGQASPAPEVVRAPAVPPAERAV